MIKPVPLTTAALALLLTSGAGAQTTVYETRDAEGNVTFSSEPSPGSRAVEIQPTDVANAPKPSPQDSEQPAEQSAGQAQEPASGGTETTIYGGGGDDVYDDPRLRREAIRDRGEPGAVEGAGETVRQDERQEAKRFDETNSGDAMENADRNAERSDVSGPDAEYRDTERPEHGGGMRR